MDNNEVIARWRGWIKTDSPIPWLTPESDRHINVPPYDRGIGFWHGEHGLLAKIKKHDDFSNNFLATRFGEALDETLLEASGEDRYYNLLDAISATPAQLAEALAKVIKEEK